MHSVVLVSDKETLYPDARDTKTPIPINYSFFLFSFIIVSILCTVMYT